MEIERETPGNDRTRSWRANVAQEDPKKLEDSLIKEPAWKRFLAHVGPGPVHLAVETDLQAGANHRYELLWVILIGLIFALIIRSLAANLGVVTANLGVVTADLMILSFELPFALIPLLKFSSSSSKMGPHKNSIYVIILSWLLGVMIIGINMYFLSTSFVRWLVHNSLPKYANVLVGLVVFPLMLIYVFAVIYLTFRKDTVVTFAADSVQVDAEKAKAAGEEEDDQPVPFRQDLADIPLPE